MKRLIDDEIEEVLGVLKTTSGRRFAVWAMVKELPPEPRPLRREPAALPGRR